MGLEERQLQSFLSLLSQVACLQGQEVDSNICCWSTGKLYTEAMLGVGIGREGKNLATAGELLSLEAYEGGVRQNTDARRGF